MEKNHMLLHLTFCVFRRFVLWDKLAFSVRPSFDFFRVWRENFVEYYFYQIFKAHRTARQLRIFALFKRAWCM